MGDSTLSPRRSPRIAANANTTQLQHAAVAPHSPQPAANKKPRSSSGSWFTLHLLLCVVGALAFFYWRYTNPASVPTPLQPVAQQSARTGLRFHSASYDPQQMDQLRWGIIFDAGSTGSRVHIYRFRLDDAQPAPVLEDEIFVEVKPGLSAFAGGVGHDASTREPGASAADGVGPDAAAESLRPLMELCLEQIPAAAHARTPISLRATAGLRLLGADASESILASIRRLFASYPFPFSATDVEVMGGSEEGVFAWLTVNYLTGMLREQRAHEHAHADATQDAAQQQSALGPAPCDHPPTAAILDLGGASTQIVFEPDFDSWSELSEQQREALYKLPYGDNQYFLYESSYLGYGLMEARRRSKLSLLSHPELQARPLEALDAASGASESRAHFHPCLSDAHEEHFEHEGAVHPVRGHAQGHASCAALVRTLFPKHHCPHHPFCSFGGHFALPLRDFDHGIYAFSYFHDRTLDLFELEEESELEPDGTVLRLKRLRDLAERVCSFSMRQQQVRAIEEVEAEKEAGRVALQRAIAARHSEGCKVVSVRDAQGKVRQFAVDAAGQHVHEHTEYEPATTAAATASLDSASQQAPDEQCMVEDKPELGESAERARQQMSSPLSAMVSDNPHLCFDLTYAHTLLHYGYDLPEDTELHIRKRLQKMEVGWCLGAMLSQMAANGWGDDIKQGNSSG